jgi:hypothetical protein
MAWIAMCDLTAPSRIWAGPLHITQQHRYVFAISFKAQGTSLFCRIYFLYFFSNLYVNPAFCISFHTK